MEVPDITVLLNLICSSNIQDPSLFDALTADMHERAELYLILLQVLCVGKDLEACPRLPIVLSSMSAWLNQEGEQLLLGKPILLRKCSKVQTLIRSQRTRMPIFGFLIN